MKAQTRFSDVEYSDRFVSRPSLTSLALRKTSICGFCIHFARGIHLDTMNEYQIQNNWSANGPTQNRPMKSQPRSCEWRVAGPGEECDIDCVFTYIPVVLKVDTGCREVGRHSMQFVVEIRTLFFLFNRSASSGANTSCSG